MSLDEAFRSVLVDVVREVVRQEMGGRSANARALTRRQAEKAMGIGRSKLQELIAEGAIKTVKDNPRLVPMSEIERYAQPRRQKPRRRALPSPVAQVGTQNPDALRDALKRGGR